MDLGSDQPLANVELRARGDAADRPGGAGVRDASAQRFRANADGVVQVPETLPTSVLQADAPWTVLGMAARADGEACLWLMREMQVVVHLQFSEPAGGARPVIPTSVTLSARHGDAPPRADGTPWEWDEAFRPGWLHGLGVRAAIHSVNLGPSLEARIAAPRLMHSVMQAQASGWISEPVQLPIPTADDFTEVQVVLQLRHRPRITGRVLDAEGRPVAGASVRLVTYGEFEDWERDVRARYASLRVKGYVLGAGTKRGSQAAVVNWSSATTSGSDGTFAIDAPRQGEAVVLVHVPGHGVARLEQGTLDSDRDLVVRLTRADPPDAYVLVTHSGRPVRAQGVAVSDVTNVDRQGQNFDLRIDAQGRMPTEWLVPGRWYWLGLSPPPTKQLYCLRWDVRPTIELTEIDVDAETALYGLPGR